MNPEDIALAQVQAEDMQSRIATAERSIWVTFRKEGIHAYPAALTDPELADVSFLGHPHRHMFHFDVTIAVTHNDRDIEFIQFKRWLESLYDSDTLQLDHQSCEMMADALFKRIGIRYPNRTVRIKISEDGENGCNILYDF